MKKQTAVEWLVINYLGLHDEYNTLSLEEIVKQAKAMEREQIMEAYGAGHNDGCAYMYDGNKEFVNHEQYYNETHKGGEQ